MNKLFIKEIIVAAGGTRKVCLRFGISDAAVTGWIQRNRIPERKIRLVSEMTGFKFTPHMIDPDIYPNEMDALPRSIKKRNFLRNHRK